MKDVKKELCLRCEAKGEKTPAETFVKIESLFDMPEELHPMCFECKKEWEKELEEIQTGLSFLL